MLQNLEGCQVHLYVYLDARMIVKFKGKLKRSPDNKQWYVKCYKTDNMFVLDSFVWECDVNEAKKTIRAFRGG